MTSCPRQKAPPMCATRKVQVGWIDCKVQELSDCGFCDCILDCLRLLVRVRCLLCYRKLTKSRDGRRARLPGRCRRPACFHQPLDIVGTGPRGSISASILLQRNSRPTSTSLAKVGMRVPHLKVKVWLGLGSCIRRASLPFVLPC